MLTLSSGLDAIRRRVRRRFVLPQQLCGCEGQSPRSTSRHTAQKLDAQSRRVVALKYLTRDFLFSPGFYLRRSRSLNKRTTVEVRHSHINAEADTGDLNIDCLLMIIDMFPTLECLLHDGENCSKRFVHHARSIESLAICDLKVGDLSGQFRRS
jgi:hypothetical protein